MVPDVPIALLVFNRPEHTRRIMEAVRTAQPRRLLVVGDGPRTGDADDAARCAEVQRVVSEGVDWPCEVETDYAAQNLGCGRRVSSGLHWVFSRAEEAIILEDDCLPSPDFFPFCAELLERYRDDPRVGQICGYTFVAGRVEREASYLFSRYGPVWGWASWRRAWKGYDFTLEQWPRVQESGVWRRIIPSARERAMRTRIYDDIRAGRLDTWDYQWGFAKMTHDLLSIIPCVNLIENIGFGPEATHPSARAMGLARGRMEFPLRHAPVVRDEVFDRMYSEAFAPGLLHRVVRCAKRLLAP